MHVKRILAASILMISLAGGTAYGQGIITGSLNGTITDPSGAVVPKATVTVANTATSAVTKVTTNDKGEVEVATLPVGTYVVTVTAQGFAPLKIEGVVVNTGAASSIGTQHLSLTASEDVTVSTSQALLQDSQAQLTTTIDAQEITDLPTGGRLDALALLIPGVVRTLSNNFANTNGTGLSSNGLRGRSNNFEIDGQTNNDNSVTGPQFFFRNEDALSQLNIITNNFSAQYGRNAGEVINYVTKSGTNVYHGSAFYNYLGSWGSSLLPSQKSADLNIAPGTAVVPRVTANEWGGTLGGPILKSKLYGFGGVLFRKITNGASPSASSGYTPDAAGLAQLAAAFPGNPFVASLQKQGPFSVTAGNPTANNKTSFAVCAVATTSCPTGSPSIEFATITRFLPSYSQDQEIIGRIDYDVTPRDRFFTRYMFQRAPTLVSGGTVSSGAYYDTSDVVYSIAGSINHTFSPHWVDQLTYSFQQSKLTFGNGGYPTCNDANISSCPSNISIGSGTFASVSYGPATNIPQGRIVKVTQVQDNANWSIGRHAVSFGGEFDYQNSPNTFLPNTSGAFSFNNFNYALAGVTTLGLANGSPNIPFKEPDFAGYIQDDWRVKPNLTLNLGLRWEFFKQGINVLNSLSTARQTGPNPIWATSLPLALTTFPYIPEDFKNFQPRLGFAYSPEFQKGLVIRGGFAIDFDPAFYNIFLNSYTAAPVVNTGIISCDGVATKCLPAGGTTNALVHTQDDVYNPTGVNPGTKVQGLVSSNFHNPYVENYTLGLQQQVGRFAVAEIRYVGNHAVGQFQSYNANPDIALAPPASVTSGQGYQTLAQAFPTAFPTSSYCSDTTQVGYGFTDCNRTYEYKRGNTAFSKYNALQTQLRTANYHGVSGTASYTWSRTIDNASEVYGTSGGGTTVAYPQSAFNINKGERGLSGDSYPNVVSLGLVYAIPAYKEQRGIVGHLIGGYSINSIWTYNTGQPWTPYQSNKLAPQLITTTSAPIGVCLQNSTGNASCAAPATAAGTAIIPYANQGQALFSFGDYYFDSGVTGLDTNRPILVNPSAPAGTVAFNAGPGVGYVDMASGKPVSRTADKWLVSNQYEAIALGNPFPGVGRNTLKGQSVNEFDMSVFKTLKFNERINGQLRINVFNLPNRNYLGTPDAAINDSPLVRTGNNGTTYHFNSFESLRANGGTIVGSPFGKGARNVELGAKIFF